MMMLGMEYPRFRSPDVLTYIIEGEYFPADMCYVEE